MSTKKTELTDKKISVIIPAFNAEKTIGKCIDSILSQTLPVYEVLVVDSSSSDDTRIILNNISRSDNRVQLIESEQLGVSSARNMALDRVSGDYIAFVDADDFIEPTMYEDMLANILKFNSDCCICGHITEKDNVRTPKTYGCNTVLSRNELLNALFSERSDSNAECNPSAIAGFSWNRLFKSSLLKEARFPDDIRIWEDTLFQLKLFAASDITVSVLDKALYHYVQNASSATGNMTFFVDDCFKYHNSYKIMNRYIDTIADNSSTDSAAVRKALFSNYRSILEYSMYSLLMAPHCDRAQIRMLQTEMKRFKADAAAYTLPVITNPRHYFMLSRIPFFYRLYLKLR